MNQMVVRVPPGPAAKVFGILYFILGVVFLPFFLLPALVGGGDQQPLALGFALFMPIGYAIMGFVGTALFCWLYNVIASRVGGIHIELDPASIT